MKLKIFSAITVFSSIGSDALSADLYNTSGLRAELLGRYRNNVRLQLYYPGDQPINPLEALKAYGVIADENSWIISHDEKALVNLDCFNCIVNFRNSSDAISSPQNDIVKGKDFKIPDHQGL